MRAIVQINDLSIILRYRNDYLRLFCRIINVQHQSEQDLKSRLDRYRMRKFFIVNAYASYLDMPPQSTRQRGALCQAVAVCQIFRYGSFYGSYILYFLRLEQNGAGAKLLDDCHIVTHEE